MSAQRRSIRPGPAALALAALSSLPAHANPADGAAPVPAPVRTQALMPVHGRVVDELSGEPIADAWISAAGTDFQTNSDRDGRFVLDLPAGRNDLEIAAEGYRTQVLPGIDVVVAPPAGGLPRSLHAPIRLRPATTGSQQAPAADTREPDRDSTAAQGLVRLRSARLSDIVSAEDIRRSGDASAAHSAARAVGVAVVGERLVYLRGLSERYTSALFNGAPLPSADLEQRAVPFEVFPAGLLANLTFSKSATPDLPADFAGGSIEINTEGFPSKLSVRFTSTIEANLAATFRPSLGSPGGATDLFGFGARARAYPAGATPGLRGPDGAPLSRAEVAALARSFQNTWTPQPVEITPPGHNLWFSLGNQHVLWGKNVGYTLAFSHSQRFQHREVEQRVLNLDGGALAPQVQLRGALGLREIRWGAIVSLSLLPAPGHSLSFSTFFSQSADDEARLLGGTSAEVGGEVQTSRLRWIERSLALTQLGGGHRLVNRSRLGPLRVDWRLIYAASIRQEPDNREVFRQRTPDGGLRFFHSGNSGQRFFSDDNERQPAAMLDLTQEFKQWRGLAARFKLGALARLRLRDFQARRFLFFSHGRDAEGRAIDTLPSAEDLFAPHNLSEQASVGVELRDNGDPADRYAGSQGVYAVYGLLDLPITARLRLVAGVRLEITRQVLASSTVDGEPARVTPLDVDPLPSAALVYRLREDMNLRAAASMTVSRPELRELAPFSFIDTFGGEVVRGNPALGRTRITNADLRWEWLRGDQNLLSVSGFFKHFDRPIETLLSPGSPLLRTFANTPSAYEVGAEVEARRQILLRPAGHAFILGANLTLVYSQVDPGDLAGMQTSTRRPMQGMSPVLLNAYVDYEHRHPRFPTQLRLMYHFTGERLDSVGTLGLPDRYQQPLHMLSATVTQQLGRGVALQLSGHNLADSPILITQGDQTALRYQTGRVLRLSLSYTW